MKKKCLECGEKLTGREDKKFCNDACRNSYNNKLNKDTTNLMRNTNYILRKNYRILCELNSEGKTKVHRKRMLENGFDYNLITSLYTTKTHNTYFFVYDQGYMPLEDDWFILVKRN
ncbi:MAG TPA: hypothetical protein VKY33_08875 [Flavobacterium sp.]|nr:hypothetical protein [Flavobacterium sp.]